MIRPIFSVWLCTKSIILSKLGIYERTLFTDFCSHLSTESSVSQQLTWKSFERTINSWMALISGLYALLVCQCRGSLNNPATTKSTFYTASTSVLCSVADEGLWQWEQSQLRWQSNVQPPKNKEKLNCFKSVVLKQAALRSQENVQTGRLIKSNYMFLFTCISRLVLLCKHCSNCRFIHTKEHTVLSTQWGQNKLQAYSVSTMSFYLLSKICRCCTSE